MLVGGLIGLVLSACADSGSTAGTVTTGVSTTTDDSVVTTSTEGPVPTTVPPLADGATFAFVADVSEGVFTVDPAIFFSDIDEANEAAWEDGEIRPDQDLPNPFYIRNTDEEALGVPVDPDGRFAVLTYDARGSFTETEVTLEDLEALFAADPATLMEEGKYFSFVLPLPMDLVTEDGRMIEARQVYIP